MGIFIIIPIAVAIILVLSAAYVKAPPNRAAVITGLRKKPRVLLGKAGFKIPFFERVDWMEVGQIDIDIETEDYIPTQDFINIRVDAIAQVSIDVEHGMDIAMRNFLNKKQDSVKSTIAKSLQGNLREIIGTMNLKDICQNKAEFSEQVKANAEGDIAELGIKILSFNVQNIKDKDGLIDDLGIDNREQIRKSASIAKAEAEKEAAILRAEAKKEAMIREAEGKAQAIAEVQKATAEGLKYLNEAAPTESVLTLKSLEAFEKASDGQATKIIIPSEIQGIAGLAKSVIETCKEK